MPARMMAAGSVSCHAIARLRTVDHCRPDPLAAMVPAMPDASTWIVETGRPSISPQPQWSTWQQLRPPPACRLRISRASWESAANSGTQESAPFAATAYPDHKAAVPVPDVQIANYGAPYKAPVQALVGELQVSCLDVFRATPIPLAVALKSELWPWLRRHLPLGLTECLESTTANTCASANTPQETLLL